MARHSPLWLTHHWPEQHERCIRLGPVKVCRRCTVLYPLAILVAVVAVLSEPPAGVLLGAMWLAPLPMSLEWVAEHVGFARHSPMRLVTTTAIASAGFGAALAAHLVQPFDLDALAPMATHATVCGVAAVVAARRSRGTWERDHRRRELERDLGLTRLLAEQDRAVRAE